MSGEGLVRKRQPIFTQHDRAIVWDLSDRMPEL